MGAIKTQTIKMKLAKANRTNRSIPMWKRRMTNDRTGYNKAKRNWRRTKLKIY